MTSERPDTFARFLEILTESLDEPDATPEDFAARAHLSRHHFDRIVTAAAGESPTRLRRRVLLERAAYRLLTGSGSLLDEAVAAGYSSHEAFTRAFERAYGAPPSAWRRAPTKVNLEAPSGVHFHPPSGLRLPAARQEHPMDLVVRMVEHHVWLVLQLVDRASRLEEWQLDAPLELRVEDVDGDSLRWLLSRLIGQMQMWNAAMAGQEYDFAIEHDESVTQMRSRSERTGREFLTTVREVCAAGGFDEMFVEAMGETPNVVTKGGMIAHVLTFAAHHRLLAVTTLARFGIDDLGLGDPKYWIPG